MAKDEEEKKEEPDPPRTEQEFKDALNELSGRAKAAGVNTLKVMLLAGIAEGARFLNTVAEGLGAEAEKAKPKRKKKP